MCNHSKSTENKDGSRTCNDFHTLLKNAESIPQGLWTEATRCRARVASPHSQTLSHAHLQTTQGAYPQPPPRDHEAVQNHAEQEAGECDGTKVRLCCNAATETVRNDFSAARCQHKIVKQKRFCTRLACVGAVLPHQKTAHCDTRKFHSPAVSSTGPQYLGSSEHSVNTRHDVRGTARCSSSELRPLSRVTSHLHA